MPGISRNFLPLGNSPVDLCPI